MFLASDCCITSCGCLIAQPIDHESIKQAREVVEKPIDLYDCLTAFTKEEKLGENETW